MRGADPALAAAVNLPWIEIVEHVEIEEIAAFARYKAGGGVGRNKGEAAVLAWASVHGGTTIIDERAGARAARRDNIAVHGNALADHQRVPRWQTDERGGTRMVDQLAATDMALPTDGAGFIVWAHEEGLLP